jgi:hypothetical protein
MSIFYAYNQKNQDEKKRWSVWPEWELCLTSMKESIHFEDEKDSNDVRVTREHWLSFFELIYNHESITYDGYTLAIKGNHGTTFSFDISLEEDCWANPGSMNDYAKKKDEWKKMKEIDSRHKWKYHFSQIGFKDVVQHSLGSFWICPKHVPNYGGMQSVHTADSWYCFHKSSDESLPLSMMSLIHLCIDDTEIWNIQIEEDQRTREYIEKMEKEWPFGRPEDYYYQ